MRVYEIGTHDATALGQLERHYAADKEKQRHVYLPDELEYGGAVDFAYTHCQDVPGHNHKNGYAFEHVVVVESL